MPEVPRLANLLRTVNNRPRRLFAFAGLYGQKKQSREANESLKLYWSNSAVLRYIYQGSCQLIFIYIRLQWFLEFRKGIFKLNIKKIQLSGERLSIPRWMYMYHAVPKERRPSFWWSLSFLPWPWYHGIEILPAADKRCYIANLCSPRAILKKQLLSDLSDRWLVPLINSYIHKKDWGYYICMIFV